MISSSPLLKIPFVLVNAVCTHICLTPPNPPAEEQEKSDFASDTTTNDVVPMLLITPISRALTQIMNFVEVAAILTEEYPRHPVSQSLASVLLPPKHLPSTSIAITSICLLGIILMMMATTLRVICYMHLGRYFTFELSLRAEHRLITDGPYAVVRHPSYTAIFIYFVGMAFSILGHGSWWAECGVWYGWGRALGMAQVAIVSIWVVFFLTRVRLEDEVLAKTFQDQWSRWSVRTPYKLFPLLY